jgi:SAM-dependent methyltransferase
MKNKDNWKESKFRLKNGVLKSSYSVKEVAAPSRIMADAIGRFYTMMLPKYAKGLLLDLGCGKVPLYAAYKDYVSDNICVDWQNSLHKNEYLDYECDLNKELPFEDNTFDTLILSDVLEHLQDPQLVWKEMRRVLKNDGILLMNVPFLYMIHEEPFDYYRYTRFALLKFAENNDFKVLEEYRLGGWVEVILDLNFRILSKLPVIGLPLVKGIYGITNFFINSSFGNKVRHITSKKYPYGYGFVFQKS